MKKLISTFSILLLIAISIPLEISARGELDDRGERDRSELRNEINQVIVTEATDNFSQNYLNISIKNVRDTPRGRNFTDTEILVKRKNGMSFRRIERTSKETIDEMVLRYQQDPEIEYAEPNYIAYSQAVPNDPYYNIQWNFDNTTTGGVHAEAAWNKTSGSGVIVAVIDTGVAYENYTQRNGWFFGNTKFYKAPDLAGTSFASGYDFVNNDSHPNDDEGHGTHVAGTIAQTTDNNTGVAGLAYDATIMPIKVLNSNGSGNYADIADGIRFAADNGASVINLSLGGTSGSSVMKNAIAYAYNKGVTIVAAAGNNGNNTVLYPAAYNDYVIAVGATRYDETKAPYSNYGADLDLVAPGGDTAVDQNNDGYADGILQQTFGNNTNDWGYYFYQGTSMAAPHVAAAAALVIANGNASTPDEVRAVLESTADDLGVAGRDNTYGYGLINLAAALNAPTTDPEIGPVNQAPEITSSALTTATEGALYSYDVDAIDDDVLAYSLTKMPTGMSINSGNGMISWIPSNAQTGNTDVIVSVSDGNLQDTQAFTITVEALSDPVTTPEPNPTPDVLFYDSFENGTAQWTQDSQNDWRINDRRATDGEESYEVDGRTRDGTVTSIPINVGSNSDVTVSFSMYLERSFDRNEYIAFAASTDGGSTWPELVRLRGNVDPENRWYEMEFNFSDISALQLRFYATASRGSEDANIDNVLVIPTP